MLENQRNIEKYNYEYLKEIERHAKNYDFVSDKKEFLRNVSPYEQKIILLHSKNPYEVLNYLDELDIKQTRKILSELTYDEIEDILLLFSSEDKEKFYSTFSDLELVNQFMVQDERALEYIDDLSIDRKVELIDASNKETIEATSIVYESISDEQKEYVSSLVSDSDAVSALSVAEASFDMSKNESNNENDNYIEEVNQNVQSEIKTNVQEIMNLEQQRELINQENIVEKPNEIVKSDNKDLKAQEMKKNNIEPQIQQKSNEQNNSLILDNFNQAKQDYKNAIIDKIQQEIEIKKDNNEFDKANQITKTL